MSDYPHAARAYADMHLIVLRIDTMSNAFAIIAADSHASECVRRACYGAIRGETGPGVLYRFPYA